MSVEITSQVWSHSGQTGNGLLLMVRLGDFADREGFAFPSQASLAQSIRCSEDTVGRLVNKAEKAAELIVFRGKRLGNRYLVIVGCEIEEIQHRLSIALPKAGPRSLSVKMSDKLKKLYPALASDNSPSLSRTAMSDDPLKTDPSIKESPKRDKKTTLSKNELDAMFDLICEVCAVDREKVSGTSIGKVRTKLINVGWTSQGLTAFRDYRKSKKLEPVGSIYWLQDEMAKTDWRGRKTAGPRKAKVDPTPELTADERQAALAKLEAARGH